jgi:hypothetical protein
LSDESSAKEDLARADAIGAWVCSMSLVAAVVLVVVYAARG